MKLLNYFLILFLLMTGNSLGKQGEVLEYEIRSLQGKSLTLRAQDGPIPGQFTFSLQSGDSICFNDVFGINDTQFLFNRQVLALNYEVQGGTSQSNGRSALLCVSKGKIHVAMDVASHSYGNYDPNSGPNLQPGEPLYSLAECYELDFQTHGDSLEKGLEVLERYREWTNADSIPSTDMKRRTRLRFDGLSCIFFSDSVKLGTVIKEEWDSATNWEYVQRKKPIRLYPELQIGEAIQIYRDEQWWYQDGRLGELSPDPWLCPRKHR